MKWIFGFVKLKENVFVFIIKLGNLKIMFLEEKNEKEIFSNDGSFNDGIVNVKCLLNK